MSYNEAVQTITDYIYRGKPVNEKRFLEALIMARQSLRLSHHLEQRLEDYNANDLYNRRL